MLRNDGEIFEIDSYHPYIIRPSEEANDDTLFNLMDTDSDFWGLEWFYKYTKDSHIKNIIRTFIKSFVVSCEKNKAFVEGDLLIDTKKYYSYFDINNNTFVLKDANEIYDMMEELNNATNQEFLRFRTSDMYAGNYDSGIYFRISSAHFNWFDYIWTIVYDNQRQISDITIVRDGDPYKAYIINGEQIYHYDIEDFINLKGRPVVEHKLINQNKNKTISMLSEGFSVYDSMPKFMGIYNYNRIFKSITGDYIRENFKDVDE